MNRVHLWIYILTTVTPALASDLAISPEDRSLKTLETFDDSNASSSWMTVNDNVMGGRSKGGFVVVDGKLRFSGSTNTNGGGFSSIRTRDRINKGLAGKEGILIRFKGDGRTYKFDLRMGNSGIAHRADFRTKADSQQWQTVMIPFESFEPTWRGRRFSKSEQPLSPHAISSIGLMIYDKRDGPFNLIVDWIKAY